MLLLAENTAEDTCTGGENVRASVRLLRSGLRLVGSEASEDTDSCASHATLVAAKSSDDIRDLLDIVGSLDLRLVGATLELLVETHKLGSNTDERAS